MAYIGVDLPLVPMLAPMLGSWVIEHLSWRVIFISHVVHWLYMIVFSARSR